MISTRSISTSSLIKRSNCLASTSKFTLTSSTQPTSTRRNGSNSHSQKSTNSRSFTSSTSNPIHSLPTLPKTIATGCKPLFSSTAVNLIGQNWQAGLLRRLNEEVKGTEFENSSLVETVIGTAQDKTMIQAFNWASLALNNGFFLSSLKPNDNVEAGPPLPPTTSSQSKTSLSSKISETFTSLTEFKSTFSSCAMAMTSSGWVWLVRDGNGNLGILPTFGAGTVLVQNRIQMGSNESILGFKKPDEATSNGEDQNQEDSPSMVKSDRFVTTASLHTRRDLHSPPYSSRPSYGGNFNSGARSTALRDGEELYPLLCLSVMEHAWLPDYGMWGKEKYLINFWDCVDWNVVQKRWEEYQP